MALANRTFEALIEIFRHLFEDSEISFDYSIQYEIDGQVVDIEWKNGKRAINGKEQKTLGKTQLPDNVLIYYSGHNKTVADLVASYENSFRKSIKGADFKDSRRFIGIGPNYKELLLALLLMQPEATKARQYICQKLGIKKPGVAELTEPVVKIVLDRPVYARGSNRSDYDIQTTFSSDRYWKTAGITKEFLDRLSNCITQTPGNLVLSEGYFAKDDRYILYLDIAKMQHEFNDLTSQDIFRRFDNLKTLGMLSEITIPVQLTNGVDATITHFSDGQFQSVYIYSIIELFKDRNCITLLDEPDAFLHPEWQFGFLKQVFEITDTTAKNNHVLMSSHSASTITTANENVINLFEFDGSKVVATKVKKSDVIKTLSAGLITFSVSEARLNIHHFLKNTTGAVLFTEGITDEMILETAWSKLYPAETRKFEIQNAFDRIFLRNLFSRDEIKTNFPGRVMFALFDFDEAYDDWNGLKKERDEVVDPYLGMTKQLKCTHHYAMLLPVPNVDVLKKQVLDTEGKPWGRGIDSHITIELLFFRDEWVGDWFNKRPTSCGGELVEFIGEKVTFAREIVPNLAPANFEVLRPLFEFIKMKCT